MNKTDVKLRKVTPAEEKLPIGKFFAWKSRDVSLAGIAIVMGYLTVFCTDFLGLNPAILGTLLLASKVLDAINDLFMGVLIDNTKSRWGKGRPYEFCIIGIWLCTALIFFCPPEWGTTLKYVWVFIMYTFVYTVFSSFLVAAQAPYMIRAFKNRVVIGKVASFGGVVTTVGAMVVSISFPLLMAKFATDAAGWRTLILIYAVPLALIGMFRFVFVKEDPAIDEAAGEQKVDLKMMFLMFKKNKYAWFYAGIMGIFNTIMGLGAASYYFKYVVGNVGIQGVMGLFGILLLPVMFFFPVIMKKIGVSKLIMLGAVLSILGSTIIFFAKANVPLLFVGGLLTAFANFPISYLGIIIIMNLSTYNQHKNLPRMEGSVSMVSSFVGNVGNGLGAAVLGILLSLSGYISQDGTAATAVAQPDSAVFMIRCLYSIVPLIGMVLIFFFAKKLEKLEKQIPEIEAELENAKDAKLSETQNA